MAKILILHSGLQGITNASFELVKRLTNAGHYVVSSTQVDRRKDFEGNGFLYKESSRLWFGGNEVFVDKFKNRLTTSFFKRSIFYDKLCENLKLDQLDVYIKEEKIDLVFIDVELHEFIIHLTSSNTSIVLISQWFGFWETDDNLPLNSKLIPNINNRPKSIWAASRRKGRLKSLLKNISTLGLNRYSFINHLAKRKSVNIKKFRSFTFPSLYAFTQFPVISMTHPGLEFGPKAFDELYYSYPMVYAERKEQTSEDFNFKFEHILNELKTKKQKLVVVTYTTMSENEGSLPNDLISALSELKNCIAIVSIVNKPAELPKDLNNVFFFNYIPQLTVLRHADLSINHGGIHTLNECIHFAVPVLVISGEKFDQNACAARIKSHGCGLVLEKESNQEEINQSIEALLQNSKFKDQITKLNHEYVLYKKDKQFEKWVLNEIQKSKKIPT